MKNASLKIINNIRTPASAARTAYMIGKTPALTLSNPISPPGKYELSSKSSTVNLKSLMESTAD